MVRMCIYRTGVATGPWYDKKAEKQKSASPRLIIAGMITGCYPDNRSPLAPQQNRLSSP